MPQNRQLAAILFTDIEGYTALMQENEQKAIRLRSRHRDILQKEHDQFNGRIIQYYGDGTLSIFPSTVHAVNCALAMQQIFTKPPRVPVRMGLHSGDIIFDEGHIYGDGVNIASRIESLGVAGCVLLSDKIHDELINHPDLKTISLGFYQFKNVKRQVEVFALDHEGLVIPERGSLKGKTVNKQLSSGSVQHKTDAASAEKSIAVLPFINLSNDPEQEYFSDGIGEEILNSLSGLKDLKVASRSSSFQFHGKNIDLGEIKDKLGVSTVLHGSIRKQGRRMRLTVQLINVEDGFHLWSEKYDRSLDDVFAVQDEVALAVTEKLKLTLLEKDRALIKKNLTHNSEAYELYLKGRFHTNKRGASIITGIHYFQLAMDLDPHFALAHSGYADANLMAAFYGLLPPRTTVEKARQAAERALELDPARCEPYCSLGCYATCFNWSWAEAEKNFLTSLEINPKYVQAHYWYGSLYLSYVKGDFLGAITHGRIAVELEPLSSICLGMYGSILFSAKQYNEALAVCKKGLQVDEDSFTCHLFLGLTYLALQQYEKGIKTFENLVERTNRFHFSLSTLIMAYCMVWKFIPARRLMNELREKAKKEYVSFTLLGLSAAHLDEPDEAFEYLAKACEEHEPLLLSLKYQSWVPDSLKEDPRFQKVLDTIGFP